VTTDRSPRAALVLRVALVAFVLAWLFGPSELRSAVPIWLPFLIALGLEVHFFIGGIRAPAGRPGPPDRGPQAVDLERYGYATYSDENEEEVDAFVAEPRARPVRRLLTAMAVIGAVAAVAWWVDSRSGWRGLDADQQAKAEALFSREASRIAGHPATIHCDEAGEHVGVVQHADGVAVVGGNVAYLAPQRCYDLYQLAFKDEVSFSPAARAIAVLAHEAWHLLGVRDEGTTQCYALQSGVELAQRLGVSEDTARRMMRQQFVENAALGRTRAEYLVTEDCRDGGRLDLNPGESRFP
jgi:hypothetical protein